MDKKIIKFAETDIEKHKFHQHNPILICDLGINKILVSHKVSFCKKVLKYFIGYKDSKKVRLL